MKKLFILLAVAALLITVVTSALITLALSDDNIAVSYAAGSGTVTIDPSKWDIPVGKTATLLILRPGSDANNVNAADIVWIDEQRVAVEDNLVFSFKLRSPAAGLYIVKVGGTDANPVVSSFVIN